MLNTLSIRNLALAADVSITFNAGLNVVTGETGAGKSLIIGALKLLLGERADKSLIRTGETTCAVHASFQLSNPGDVNAILEEQGLAPCDQGELILRRTITEHSNKTFVNDQAVTLNTLRQLGVFLVDMHGPYDHQSLLDPVKQLKILDEFGRIEPLRTNYQAEYKRLRVIETQIAELQSKAEDGDLEQRIEFLEYRINEVAQEQLSVDEEAEVSEEHALVGNAQNIIILANQIMQVLNEGEYCAFESLAAAQRDITQLSKTFPEAEGWSEQMESIIDSVQDLSRSIEMSAGNVDISPERMEWLDDRMTTYQMLKRKYGASVEQLLLDLDAWRVELDDLKGLDMRRLDLEVERELQLKQLRGIGTELHEKRVDVADTLSGKVTAELVDLGFEHGFFDILLNTGDPTPTGLDQIDFGFAPNAGEEMRPLRMIASSGEISRVMLATKAVLAQVDRVPLLVFDEIDANVGGEIANAVGHKLAEVAKHHQLICITHLPQVAVHGNTHFAVKKRVENERTFTAINPLSEEARCEEVARMLGGKDLTASVMQHAKELIQGTLF